MAGGANHRRILENEPWSTSKEILWKRNDEPTSSLYSCLLTPPTPS